MWAMIGILGFIPRQMEAFERAEAGGWHVQICGPEDSVASEENLLEM